MLFDLNKLCWQLGPVIKLLGFCGVRSILQAWASLPIKNKRSRLRQACMSAHSSSVSSNCDTFFSGRCSSMGIGVLYNTKELEWFVGPTSLSPLRESPSLYMCYLCCWGSASTGLRLVSHLSRHYQCNRLAIQPPPPPPPPSCNYLAGILLDRTWNHLLYQTEVIRLDFRWTHCQVIVELAL